MPYGSSSFGSEAYGGSSNITPTGQITFFLESVLIKYNVIKTFTLDARLILRNSKTFTLDAYLQKTFSKNFTINAYLKILGTKKTFALDSRLVHQRKLNFNIDGARRKTQSNTFTIGARTYVIINWLSGWKYRKNIEVTGVLNTSICDYQIKITIHKGIGTDTTTDIYCNNHVKNNFNDIRFTDSDGKRLLNYWIQEYTNGDVAVVWVKLRYIPSAPDTTNIYLYYGNATALYASNITNTMIWGDDFIEDLSKWTYPGNVSVEIDTNKDLHIYYPASGTTGYGGVKSLRTLSQAVDGNFVLEFVNTRYSANSIQDNFGFGLKKNTFNIIDTITTELPIINLIEYFFEGDAAIVSNEEFLTRVNSGATRYYTPYIMGWGGGVNRKDIMFKFQGIVTEMLVNNVSVDALITTDDNYSVFVGLENDPDYAGVEDVYISSIFTRKFALADPIFLAGAEQIIPAAGRNIMRTHRINMKIFNG